MTKRFFHSRTLLSSALCLAGIFLVAISLAAPAKNRFSAQHSHKMSSAPSQAPGWTMVPSPNDNHAGQENNLHDVACVSDADCWAVGEYFEDNTNTYQTLIQHWNGAAWSIVTSPNPNNGQYNYLEDVTCNSSSNCWAVGRFQTFTPEDDPYKQYTLVEHWDGVSWTIVASPSNSAAQENGLQSVTCVSQADCWAVGYYSVNSDRYQTLTEHWNGVSWATVTSANTSPTEFNSLYGVTCLSTSDCWAVGTGGYNSMAQHWNGATWAIVTTSTTDFDLGVLESVTCTSPSQCLAVGNYYSPQAQAARTLILRWNGTSWGVTPSPNATTDANNELNDVSCVSAQDCWAVGYFEDSKSSNMPSRTIGLHWNGNSWSLTSWPDAYHYPLNGITCTTNATCWAVGWSEISVPNQDGQYVSQTSIQRWHAGSWTDVESPDINTGPQPHYLLGVACSSTDDCWAVGYRMLAPWSSQDSATLIEHWNGQQWSLVPSPNSSSATINRLRSVACTSATNCWAVGDTVSYGDWTQNRVITLHWDGNAWTMFDSPSPPMFPTLTGISCGSSLDCWAVGNYSDSRDSSYHTLLMHWNGMAWSMVPQSESPTLQGVTCNSASDCWAVGYTAVGGRFGTLTQHWNGTSWTIVSSPNYGTTQSNYLNSVTCSSVADCWAVGRWRTDTSWEYYDNRDQVLALHWNGSSWELNIPANADPNLNNSLSGVACTSAMRCWTVGSYGDFYYPYHTLVEQWDSNAWSIEDNDLSSSLTAITCPSASECWAVGNNGQTLIEHFTAAPAVLDAVLSRKSHGSAGTFDVALPINGSVTESRNGGANGNYTLVFDFANSLATVESAAVVSGTGSITGAAIQNGNYVVNLSGLTSGQTLSLRLKNVTDSAGGALASFDAGIRVLIGDTNGDGQVNSADISQTKSQSGQGLTTLNFREDVNADGVINSADISLVKSRSGTALPTQQASRPSRSN